MNTKHLAASLAAVLAIAGGARAAAIYDNLDATPGGADPVDQEVFGPLYDSFSTGGTAYDLRSISLLLSLSGPANGGETDVALFADDDGAPDTTPILDFDVLPDSQLTGSPEVYSTETNYVLAANTRYWIGLRSTDGGLAQWSWSLDTSGPGVAGEFFANQSGVFPYTDGPYQMELSDVAVPEPAAWALMLVGVGAVGFAARRRAKPATATA
jgi:hypothetical protein